MSCCTRWLSATRKLMVAVFSRGTLSTKAFKRGVNGNFAR